MSLEDDPRYIGNGNPLPTELYCDQPDLVRTDDGAWLGTITTGAGREGQGGQHVVSFRSLDCGQTWSDPIDVEAADGPEASYAVLLKVPGGRVYCFYNHNTDNVREAIADDPPFAGGVTRRVDSLGHYVFKYTDDHGQTWSERRFDVPVRAMQIDRDNPYGGELQFFWNVGRPFIHDGAAYISLHKVGGFGNGFFTSSEGVLVRSDNILTETNPERIAWETLPDGDAGLRTPPGGGPIAEEHSYSVLSDGSFYSVYRTIDGHPCCAYSRDRGRSWSTPAYKCFDDGRLMKHPRAANFAWKCANGNFLYWFHHNGGKWYEDRNPVWLCGGVEADSPDGRVIRWSQPEIALYDPDPFIRISYPDLIEEGGDYYLTETQKDTGRIHRLDPALLEGLWAQFTAAAVAADGLVLELPAAGADMPVEVAMPALPQFCARDNARADHGTKRLGRGFTIDLSFSLQSLAPCQTLLDSRTDTGQGLALLTTTPAGALELVMNDGRTENRWACDPGLLEAGRSHHLTAIVDAGPRVISFVVDGRLGDGGEHRQFGWGRFSPDLRGANGGDTLRLAPGLESLRLYDRYLTTSEAIANHRA